MNEAISIHNIPKHIWYMPSPVDAWQVPIWQQGFTTEILLTKLNQLKSEFESVNCIWESVAITSSGAGKV